ncbi:MAG: glycosyltransferase [Bacteroidaceae bacterium]|nr:glycosyltransferase [Bacteroidaceae bacterium]
MKYSFIVPIYNRPDEVAELLESLSTQEVKDFEVVVVEDGSDVPCREVCDRYAARLDVKYFEKPNGGPGPARNFGAERARGEWLIILDSDVVVPPGYLAAVERELADTPADAFGGPDRAHPSFTPVQKAINYAMTSFFTTGGIRGGKKKLDKFYPRSFNMGVRADVYRRLGGFSPMRFGEDIDFSTRIFKAGLRCRLFPEAWVWHKRRTDLRKFFKQVHNSGIARIHLTVRHPGTLKLVHLLPAAFTVGVATLLLTVFCGLFTALFAANDGLRSTGLTVFVLSLLPLLLYALLVCTDAACKERSLRVGLLAVAASYVQLTGYGTGFIRSAYRRYILHSGEFEAFKDNFYK